MGRTMKGFIKSIILWIGLLISPLLLLPVSAGPLQDSPYVTFSPDGKAFTTNAWDRETEWYDQGTVVKIGMTSTLREPGRGEHYFKKAKSGELAVGSWRVEYRTGTCCHRNYPPDGESYHDIVFGRNPCGASYYSGWMAYCADCDGKLLPYYVYMSKDAASNIKSLDTSLDYYYLCPFCTNLEQGVSPDVHWCLDISWNRYQVQYDCNASGQVSGYMENSLHMYNNETTYEGRPVTPSDRLSKNTYVRIGYEFTGWNTKPDGSGICFSDRERIWNLTDENYGEAGKGIVVLYAQWQKASGLLRIDPAGGSYEGRSGITEITGAYGSCYTLDTNEVTAPEGARVTFQTNGGMPIEDVTGTMFLTEWLPEGPFLGKLSGNTYYFTAASGNVDTVRAVYDREAVVLPAVEKEGSAFGGWYYDPGCTMPAGREGDCIVPDRDVTLYAKWVDLVLFADDNYSANGGKGAVDLTWAQNDGQTKSYMLYQSADNQNWTLVADAEDVSNSNRVDRTFSYSGEKQVYVVPYTGLYTLTACGAQGGNYGDTEGGYGGRVTGQVWLEKGERLTYTVGGQDGFHGGGEGTVFGNGGGCTSVESDLKGSLMIAGGGGGATVDEQGGEGGSLAGNPGTGIEGESGEAGGGGGYPGGKSGKVEYHYHSEECYIVKDTSHMVMSYPDVLGPWAQTYSSLNYCYECFGSYYAMSKNVWEAGAHGREMEEAGVNLYIGDYIDQSGSRKCEYIPTEGNRILNIHVMADSTGGSGSLQAGKLIVWDQDGQVVFEKDASQMEQYTGLLLWNQESINTFLAEFESNTGGRKGRNSGWYSYYSGVDYSDHSAIYWNEKITLPEGTTGVRIFVNSTLGSNEVWFSSTIQEISFEGKEKIKICAYEEDGALVSSSPSCGGGNYANAQVMTNYVQEAGKNKGDGSFIVQAVNVGYRDELFLKGVKAEDKEPPAEVEADSVKKNALDQSHLTLSWKEPEDKGTEYYHRVESYLKGSREVLSHSNVTKNTLISGVKGYYYLIDEATNTEVDSATGFLVTDREIKIPVTEDVQYFHLAPVDQAGNVGATTHIRIGKSDEEVAWPIWTEGFQVSSATDSVFFSEEDTYYVKCDGQTPFRLDFAGFLVGQATPSYQVNHLMYHMLQEGDDAVILDVYTPGATVIDTGVIVTNGSGVTKTLTGKAGLRDDSYTVTRRSDNCRRLFIEQRFVMEPYMDGKRMWVVPGAGADFGKETIFSEWEKDVTHGIWLIGDHSAPTITGVEAIEQFMSREMSEGDSSFLFEASDEGSGVKEFYMEVVNGDSGSRKRYNATDDLLIVDIREESEYFRGDFTVTFYAVDQVGNETVIHCAGEGFALTAYVERMQEPHEPIFRCGESGYLYITAYGYPDRIEVVFPKEMTALDGQLNTVFVYDGTVERQEEKYPFTVPLKVPLGEFEIEVKAWKDGETISRFPIIWLLGEEVSVLDDIRTRLR